MSVYQVTVQRKESTSSFGDRYAVEADCVDDACKMALGAQAAMDRCKANELEVTAVQKTGMRGVLMADSIVDVYS